MKTFVLSIAGFDPSGGAGILSDIKTFEAAGVYGLGVCSAITIQNDISFEKVEWLKKEIIVEQIEVLLKRFKINFVKIGLIENLDTLKHIIAFLRSGNPAINITWDPILKASAGFGFHEMPDMKKLKEIYKELYLITPNREEIKVLAPAGDDFEGAETIGKHCAVLLKGGHAAGEKATDILFEKGRSQYYESERIRHGEKHGSGCVLSAAITAYAAMGFILEEACGKGKEYVSGFLSSSETLLGYHYKGGKIYGG